MAAGVVLLLSGCWEHWAGLGPSLCTPKPGVLWTVFPTLPAEQWFLKSRQSSLH